MGSPTDQTASDDRGRRFGTATQLQVDNHYAQVITALRSGRLVPFLGAGINLYDEPPAPRGSVHRWSTRLNRPPSGSELADHLASAHDYPDLPTSGRDAPKPPSGEPEPRRARTPDLIQVAQWLELKEGWEGLCEILGGIFHESYPPSGGHEVLASLPGAAVRLREGWSSNASKYAELVKYAPLAVTTNYDDLLERAFDSALGENNYDVLTYVARTSGVAQGHFVHQRGRTGEPVTIEYPPEYSLADDTPVILKLHGAVDKSDSTLETTFESYVIAEDHYVEILSKPEWVPELLPPRVGIQLRHSRFLFLGYSLSDWNLRVVLNRIWSNGDRKARSWVVATGFTQAEAEIWDGRGVTPYPMTLKAYMTGLRHALNEELGARAANRPHS